MSTVIDALIVKLGLDNRDFKKGAKEVEGVTKQTKESLAKSAKEMEAANKKILEGFQKITTEALRFFSVLTAGRGVADFTRDVIEGEASLQRFSENVGVAVSTLSQWGRATELVGGSQDAFNGTVSNITKMFTGLRTGNYTPMFDLFNRLHVAMTDVNGQARSVPDLLKGTADAMAKMQGTRADKFNFLTSSGIDAGTANLILKGPQAMQAMLAEQAKQAAITDEQAKKAEKLNEQWIIMRQQLEAIGMNIVSKVTPVMLGLWGVLNQIGDWFMENKGTATAFFIGVAAAATVAAVPLIVLVAPFLAIIAAITATGAAFAALWLAISNWSTAFNAMVAAIPESWKAAFRTAFSAVRNQLTEMANNVKTIFSLLGHQLVAPFSGAFSAIGALWDSFTGRISGFLGGNSVAARIIRKVVGVASAIGMVNGEQDVGAPTGSAPPAATAPTPPSGSDTSSIPGRLAGVRSVRNFNPGNLNFANQDGAVRESGPGARFARFTNMRDGIAALARQILLYKNRDHLGSLNSIMGKFAPMSENNTQAYVGKLAQGMGVSGNQQLDLSNPAVMQALIKGISQYEAGGSYLSNADIGAGMARGGMGGGSSTVTNTTSIGHITVVTQAQDARGVARDMRQAIVTQNESGMR